MSSHSLARARERGEIATASEARRHPRRSAVWSAFLDTGAGAFACVLLNLSHSGAMVQLATPVTPEQPVMLMLEPFGALRGKVVWRLADKGKIGIRFLDEPETVARLVGGALL